MPRSLPVTEKSRGCVVNMSSMTGLVGAQGHAAYSVTKGAINTMTQSLAADWGKDGIRVNAVCPSSVQTEAVDRIIDATENPAAVRAARQATNFLNTVASPEQIASVAVFLASPAAAFMTGALVPVSGGSELGYSQKS